MKIDYKKISEELKIGKSTLYQWKTKRPELYNFIINSFQNTETNSTDNNKFQISEKEKQMLISLRELEKEEQELYYHEIKARALRKKLG